MAAKTKPSIGILASVLGLLAVAGLLGFWMLGQDFQPKADGLLQPNDPQIVATGAKIYAENCAACHGANLQGQANWKSPDAEGYLPAPPHDETGHTWHHRDEQLFMLTKYGIGSVAGADYRTRMPAYEDVLSDEQIVAVLSFIKSQWPEDVQAQHDQINAAAKR